jgi:hypothetical protein
MLVPIVFIVAFMLALTGALLENSLRAAKDSLHAAVARYSQAAIADGVADFTHGLASFVARHGASGPWPDGTSSSIAKPVCAAGPTAACPFRYVISATITAASSAGDSTGADAVADLQATAIDEQRVSAVVTATVIGPSGARLGARTRFLTYRVFGAAPYAVISGSRDIATVNGAQAAAQDDSGGAPGAGSAASGLDDTRIHVRLTCSSAGNDGLPWGNAQGEANEAPCVQPDVPADAFRNVRWRNGDTNASGWTQ